MASSKFTWTTRVNLGTPKRLAGIMEMGAEAGWDWSLEELGSISQHQMQLSVKLGFQELSPVLPEELDLLLEKEQKLLPKHFGDLFTQRKTDKRLLQWAEKLAWRCLEKKQNPLPRNVVQLILCLAEAASNNQTPQAARNRKKTSQMHLEVMKWPWLSATWRTILIKHLHRTNSSASAKPPSPRAER